jgi:hypothetical protein
MFEQTENENLKNKIGRIDRIRRKKSFKLNQMRLFIFILYILVEQKISGLLFDGGVAGLGLHRLSLS